MLVMSATEGSDVVTEAIIPLLVGVSLAAVILVEDGLVGGPSEEVSPSVAASTVSVVSAVTSELMMVDVDLSTRADVSVDADILLEVSKVMVVTTSTLPLCSSIAVDFSSMPGYGLGLTLLLPSLNVGPVGTVGLVSVLTGLLGHQLG